MNADLAFLGNIYRAVSVVPHTTSTRFSKERRKLQHIEGSGGAALEPEPTLFRVYTLGGTMSSERIHSAMHVLGSHHSNSGLPRIALDRLTLQEGHYNMSGGKGQDGNQSWKLAYCKQHQKKGALFW